MNDIFTFIVPLLGIGVLQGLFLSCILVGFRKGNKKANFMLMLVVLIYSGSIFTSFLAFSGMYKATPHFFLIFYPLGRIVGPAFYFFAIFLLYPRRKVKWYDFLHLIPMIYLTYQMMPFYMLPSMYKIATIEYLWFNGKAMNLQSFLIHILWQIHTLVYIIITIFFLKKSVKKIKNYSSDTFIDFIEWLYKFTGIFFIFLLLATLSSVVCFLLDIPGSKSEVIIDLIITLFIHFIAFTAIRQPEKLFFTFNTDKLRINEEKPTLIQKESLIPLLEIVENEKLYLNPDLKVHHIAALLDVTPHQISRLINQEQGINFYTFINKYRVEEFKKRVDSNNYNHMTLLGIALSVGFNSKSSFNRIFKNHTQMTPSEYYRLKKVSSSSIRSSDG